MKLTVKGTGLRLTSDLYQAIEEKIGGLDKFAGSLKARAFAHGQVEVGRTTKHHRTGAIFRAEVELHLPGRDLRAQALDETIFGALDIVKDELKRELRRYGAKRAVGLKQGGRQLKKLIRGADEE